MRVDVYYLTGGPHCFLGFWRQIRGIYYLKIPIVQVHSSIVHFVNLRNLFIPSPQVNDKLELQKKSSSRNQNIQLSSNRVCCIQTERQCLATLMDNFDSERPFRKIVFSKPSSIAAHAVQNSMISRVFSPGYESINPTLIMILLQALKLQAKTHTPF